MPEDTPIVNQLEAHWYGARAFLVDGLIHDCGAIVREGAARGLWFDMSTMKEPYRLEGKKTMGFELAEQLGWRLPSVILYPTGGGTGLIGMHKAFGELRELGWLDRAAPLPRLFACQAAGCAPIVAAFAQGLDAAPALTNAHTNASGLRVPKAFADFLILRAVRETGGRAVAAAEERLTRWMQLAMSSEGVALCPEAAAGLDVLATSLADGSIRADEEVVLFNTGAATKYVEFLRADLPRLRREAVDWRLLEQS
jgi:threonine synthase